MGTVQPQAGHLIYGIQVLTRFIAAQLRWRIVAMGQKHLIIAHPVIRAFRWAATISAARVHLIGYQEPVQSLLLVTLQF